MYLEELLGTITDEKANVMVLLNSCTLYGVGEALYPHAMQDGMGNHYKKNWVTALDSNDLNNVFTVLAHGYDKTTDTYVVTVDKKKGDKVAQILDYESNRAAIRNMFD